MGLVFWLIMDAAIIGVVIAVMEKGEFPGWGSLIACVLAIGITSGLVGSLLPGALSLLGSVAGAIVGAFLISWLMEMEFRRSLIAVGIYWAISFALSLVWWLVTGA